MTFHFQRSKKPRTLDEIEDLLETSGEDIIKKVWDSIEEPERKWISGEKLPSLFKSFLHLRDDFDGCHVIYFLTKKGLLKEDEDYYSPTFF